MWNLARDKLVFVSFVASEMAWVMFIVVLLPLTPGRGHAQVRGQVGTGGAATQQGLRQLIRFRSSYGSAWQNPAPVFSLRTGKCEKTLSHARLVSVMVVTLQFFLQRRISTFFASK